MYMYRSAALGNKSITCDTIIIYVYLQYHVHVYITCTHVLVICTQQGLRSFICYANIDQNACTEGRDVCQTHWVSGYHYTTAATGQS